MSPGPSEESARGAVSLARARAQSGVSVKICKVTSDYIDGPRAICRRHIENIRDVNCDDDNKLEGEL